MTTTHPLHSLLIELEQHLKLLNLWQADYPSAEAMAYQEPFAIDTMPFENWLQFVLIPRFSEMLQSGSALPPSCHTAEMAEVVWADDAERLHVIGLLRQLDQFINQPPAGEHIH